MGRRNLALTYATGFIVAVLALAVLLIAAGRLHERRVQSIRGIERDSARSSVDTRMAEAGAIPNQHTRDTVSYAFPFPTRGLSLVAQYTDDRLQSYVLRDKSESAQGPPLLIGEAGPPPLGGALVLAAILVVPLTMAFALRVGGRSPRVGRNEALAMTVFAYVFEAAWALVLLVFLRKAGIM